MKVKFNFHIECPLKDNTFWEDIRQLEVDLMNAIIEKYRENPYCAEVRCAAYSDRLEHDQEEIKSRPEKGRQ